MTYRFYLSGGQIYEGDDERDVNELIPEISLDQLSTSAPSYGWTWVAGLHVRAAAILAIEPVKEEETE